MRVIAGKAKHLPLKSLEGMNTRPTTDRIKETLFNMLQNDVPGCIFLDLFSGSGAIGIEALSRGAERAYFVEQNRGAIQVINSNLKFTRLEESARVLSMDVMQGIARLEGQEVFDIIFMDPPYDHEYEKQVLSILRDSSIVDSDTLIIVEASLKTSFSYLEEYGFELVKYKKYKTNAHIFLQKKGV